MASKVFVSPGVYTSEKELSFVSQSVGVTTLGLVGETLKGPAFEPIFITSYDEFESYFGGTSPEKFVNTQIPKYEASYIAKSYLQQSNQLFVTRILGLSGYDAGPSWSIKTVANVNCSTVGVSAAQFVDGGWVAITGTTGTSYTSVIIDLDTNSGMPQQMFDLIYAPIQKYDGSTSTIYTELQKIVYNLYFSSYPNNNYVSEVLFLGPNSVYNEWTGSTKTIYNPYGIQDLNLNTIDFCDGYNDSWFYNTFNITNGDSYAGVSFVVSGTNITLDSLGGGVFKTEYGLKIGFTLYTGTSHTNYNNLVVSTLRSRGVSEFTSTKSGPQYVVSSTTNASLIATGSYSGVTTDPYALFKVSGLTTTSSPSTFQFEVTLDNTNANFITKVLGDYNFEKDSTQVPLYVEEMYSNLLSYGYRKGYIRGLNTSFVELQGSRTGNTSSIANYLERYQTPVTPYFVSELRGNKVYDLFRFVSISDGNAANTEIKVSIGNISFNSLTFDVFVRQYNDLDSNPVILEKFTNCTMDANSNSYIGKRIGTSDGEFAINSRYIMVELNPDAPYDSLPCGYNGYIIRNYASNNRPFPIFKTKYDYPGEVIFNPPFGTNGTDDKVISNGDNVRRTYLGFSTSLGSDSDFLQYKGKKTPVNGFVCGTNEDLFVSWNWLTKGFHMDSGATVVTISSEYLSSGDTAFFVGSGSFTSEPETQTNPYYRLFARKYTAHFYGGFDGWDVYRERRTNSDEYLLGKSGYKAGANACVPYTDSTGWGAFRTIVVDGNETDYANTDYYAYLIGIQTFNNPSTTNINVLTTPGVDYVNNYELVNATITMVEFDRADSIYITTTPDFELLQPSTSMDNLIYPQDAVSNLETQDIDSNYTATYYPWVLTRDTVNNTQIYLPATAEVTRNLALTDNIAFPWFATAGYTRGIVNSVRARRRLTQEERDTLYKGRINPIATFNDVGTVIWGNKTLQIRESALDRINVRRLLLQARKLISAVAVRLLFEQNDNIVRQQFLDSVNPILDAIRRDRGLYDFRVTVSNSTEDLDNNQLTGKIYIKPTKALEFIDIEFLITPTGASFENI
jgi:hypothetical protein